MDKDLDELLSDDLLEMPDDFSARVMLRIHRLPVPARRSSLLEKLQNLALVAGGIIGATQLATFMFGIWTVSSVG
jgi:hypothetical protein